MKDIIVGIDAGTSVIKSVAFDLDGKQIGIASRKNNYHTDSSGMAVQNMQATWDDCAATLRQLGEEIPDLNSRIAALAVTAQGDGTWLIDKKGKPVGDGWIWLDARSAKIVDQKRLEPSDKKRYQLTGTGLSACQQGAQLMWMKQNTPEILAQAATALHPKDWLHFKLTGEPVSDVSEMTFTFGDFRSRKVSDDVLEALGLEKEKRLLPTIIDGTKTRFTLSQEAASQTGLPEGMPVILGYLDVVCTALGAGLFEPDARPGCTIIGSTGMHLKLERAGNIVLNEDATGYVMCLPQDDYVAHIQSNMASTLNIDWALSLVEEILSEFGEPPSHSEILARLDRWVESADAASIIYLPYISEAGERGPFVDATARASFHGLNVRNGYRDLLRAVVESLAFAARDCYKAMGELPHEIRLTGGAARSKTLLEIFSSVLGRPVRTSSRGEAGAAGAAMMACVSLGIYPNMLEASKAWALPLLDAPQAQNQELMERYLEAFPLYEIARGQMKDVWHAFAERKTL